MTRGRNNLFLLLFSGLLSMLRVPAVGVQNQSPQNVALNLTGRWETGDHRQFDVVQTGQHVHATLLSGDDKCTNGGTLDYLFDGELSGAGSEAEYFSNQIPLAGKMNACTAEKLVQDCALPKVWSTTFNATAAADVISGDVFIEGRNTKCQLDSRFDTHESFTVTPCEDIAVSQDDAQITPEQSTRIKIRVTCHQLPVPNATVQISLKAQDKSGGHAHDGDRPRGQLDGYTVLDDKAIERKTDANGNVTNGVTQGITFDPPYKVPESKNVGIAGIYEVTVKSKRLPKHGGTLPVLVQFTNLTSLLESPQAYYEISRNHTDTHPDGTFGTQATLSHFQSLAIDFYHRQEIHNQQLQACKKPTWGLPVKASVNDIALPTGGLFDWKATWKVPHQTHGKGQGGDFNRFSEIPDDQTKEECDGEAVAYRSWLIHTLLEIGKKYGRWDCSDLGADQPLGPSVPLSSDQCTQGEFPDDLDWIPPNLHLHVED